MKTSETPKYTVISSEEGAKKSFKLLGLTDEIATPPTGNLRQPNDNFKHGEHRENRVARSMFKKGRFISAFIYNKLH